MKKKVFVAIVAAYSMISFIIGVVLIIVLSNFFLLSCENSEYSGDWRISNKELVAIYFPKYSQYVKSVIDEYDLAPDVSTNITEKGAFLDFVFQDGYTLNIDFWVDSSFEYGEIQQTLKAFEDSLEKARETPEMYFEIMHKINLFSVYELQGDERTFKQLLQDGIERGNNVGYFYYIDRGSLGKWGYSSWVYLNNDQKWKIQYIFNAALTDKNIWKE